MTTIHIDVHKPSDDEVKHAILKLHYRTFDKVWSHIHRKYSLATKEQVKDVINTLLKDPKRLDQKKYYNPIFSTHPHAWMMDLLDNDGKTEDYPGKAEIEQVGNQHKKQKPNWWYIFININTKFACAYPLKSKKVDDVFSVLKQFLSEHKCVSLTSDKESAFVSDTIVNYCKTKEISQYIVLDGNHTSLSPIDSFIRHLRDRNITNEKAHNQSHHSKYRNFSYNRMEKLITTYNKTIHSTTKMTPEEMENDLQKERKYIAHCLIRRSKMKNYDIPNGHFVRIVLDKSQMKKKRFKLSRECYKVSGRDGKNYFISAEDETRTSLPRWKLIDLGKDKPNNINFANTIPGTMMHEPKGLIKDGNSYIVDYGNAGSGRITKGVLRRHHPQIETKLERELDE